MNIVVDLVVMMRTEALIKIEAICYHYKILVALCFTNYFIAVNSHGDCKMQKRVEKNI